jgi:hypothetical protein
MRYNNHQTQIRIVEGNNGVQQWLCIGITAEINITACLKVLK